MDRVIRKSGRSARLWRQAQTLFPGGVNSPVRSFRGVGGEPFFVQRGMGAVIEDADGNRMIDYVLSWGALILGHAAPSVAKAVRNQMNRGSSYGIPTSLESKLALEIKDAFPSIELLRFVSSGTEASLTALRLARGFTGRERIVKFSGGYHGHVDELLVRAGSGAATLGLPTSRGVSPAKARQVLVLPYNHVEAVRNAFRKLGPTIAACIVEPVAGNMGVVEPSIQFLKALREETQRTKSLLIFDEVMSGFRVARGGAQERTGIRPDLTLLGKIVGGGLPCACIGGRAQILRMLAPLDGVYQAGTLSGNPLAMAAGLATLQTLRTRKIHRELDRRTKSLVDGMRTIAADEKVPVWINQAGSMFTLFFSDRPVTDDHTALGSNVKRYALFFHEALRRGVYFPPSAFEASFVSWAHTDPVIHKTLKQMKPIFKILARHAHSG